VSKPKGIFLQRNVAKTSLGLSLDREINIDHGRRQKMIEESISWMVSETYRLIGVCLQHLGCLHGIAWSFFSSIATDLFFSFSLFSFFLHFHAIFRRLFPTNNHRALCKAVPSQRFHLLPLYVKPVYATITHKQNCATSAQIHTIGIPL